MDKKIKNLNLNDKVKVIKMITEKKMKIREVARRFKCGKTQIYNTLKQKNKLIEIYSLQNNNDLFRKKERITKYTELNRIVFEWYSEARATNLPISGPILQQKAKETARMLQLDGFTGSNGWLHSFRKRHDISFNNTSTSTCKEIGNDLVENWQDNLKEIIRHYNVSDIANVDETILFYRVLPNEMLQLKNNNKCSREYLTVLLVAFADGTLEKPLVIGKNENPKCFKNLKKSRLPVEWVANKKSWMTSAIFEGFLRKLNDRMKKERRNILLFLDDATCHQRIQLSNIRLVFLPSNGASIFQPLDNGIIRNVKLIYRKLVLQHLIANLDDWMRVSDLTIKIDVLDAITFLGRSVKCLKDNDIRKCFQNCGFIFYDNDIEFKEEHNTNDYKEIQNLIDVMYRDDMNVANAESFVNCDEHVFKEMDEIVLQNINVESDDNDVEEEDGDEIEVPTPSQVISYFNAMKNYAKMNGENEFYDKIVDLEFSFNNNFFK